MENTEERLQRYRQSTLSEVSSPEFWQEVHHFQESDSSEEWARHEQEVEAQHTREEALRGGEVQEEGLRGEEGSITGELEDEG